mmetsp:Transcript_40494/g.67671  ORF Transcript_40494/g.67671 Transcript_40494/m.67671 type:complete len:134 (+) Transcript_40494:206-607(+)
MALRGGCVTDSHAFDIQRSPSPARPRGVCLVYSSHGSVAGVDQYRKIDHSRYKFEAVSRISFPCIQTNLIQMTVDPQSASDSGCNISVRGPMEGERNTTTSSRVMTLCLANPSSLLFPYALYYAVFGQPHSDV